MRRKWEWIEVIGILEPLSKFSAWIEFIFIQKIGKIVPWNVPTSSGCECPSICSAVLSVFNNFRANVFWNFQIRQTNSAVVMFNLFHCSELPMLQHDSIIFLSEKSKKLFWNSDYFDSLLFFSNFPDENVSENSSMSILVLKTRYWTHSSSNNSTSHSEYHYIPPNRQHFQIFGLDEYGRTCKYI